MISPLQPAALLGLLAATACASPITISLPSFPSPIDLKDLLAGLKTSPIKRADAASSSPLDLDTITDLLSGLPTNILTNLLTPGLGGSLDGANILSLANLLGGAGSPTPVKREPLDLSIPSGIIPLIPGLTEPLTTNAPPLPILQLPTPPLESDPFTPSNIQPKKIGYFWTGAGDNWHKDFLVTASLDDVSPSTSDNP